MSPATRDDLRALAFRYRLQLHTELRLHADLLRFVPGADYSGLLHHKVAKTVHDIVLAITGPDHVQQAIVRHAVRRRLAPPLAAGLHLVQPRIECRRVVSPCVVVEHEARARQLDLLDVHLQARRGIVTGEQ